MNMTEIEAIEFTISKGFKGEEFKTQAWKKGGCLKKDGTYKKLVKKLECYFETVDVDGTGKEKVYALNNPKAEPTAMVEGRKGREMPRKVEDEILTGFVHRMLIELIDKDREATTYNQLREKIPFVLNQTEMLRSVVAEVLNDYVSVGKLRGVWSYTDWYLFDRAKKDIQLAIEHLAEDKQIKVETKWIANHHESIKKIEIEIDEANRVHEAIERLSIVYEIDYIQYQKSFALPFKSQKMMDFQSIVESYLQENFGYNYIYKAMEIEVLDFKPKVVVTYEKVKEVYLQKVKNLVADKVKSDKYRKAQNMGEKFHYLCTLLYLKANGIQVDEQELKEEIEGIPYRLHEITKSYDKPKPVGFGNSEIE